MRSLDNQPIAHQHLDRVKDGVMTIMTANSVGDATGRKVLVWLHGGQDGDVKQGDGWRLVVQFRDCVWCWHKLTHGMGQALCIPDIVLDASLD